VPGGEDDLSPTKKEEKTAPNLVPRIKNFTKDDYSEENFRRDLNKMVEARGTFLHYMPSEDIRELEME